VSAIGEGLVGWGEEGRGKYGRGWVGGTRGAGRRGGGGLRVTSNGLWGNECVIGECKSTGLWFRV
jgi:hypothetical protein